MSTRTLTSMAVIFALGAMAHQRAAAGASLLDSVFTFQGKVAFDGIDLNDTADFEFTLWDDAGGDNPIGAVQAVNNVDVIDGLFTVDLDFGSAVFNGEPRWIEIAMRSPAGAGVFSTLTPRQPLSAAPYALHTRGIHVADGGNVGIGTETPAAPLELIGDAWFGADLFFTTPGVFEIAHVSNTGLRIDPGALKLHLEADNSVALTATADGNVGIGTANPNKLLTVNGGGLSVYDDAAQGIHLTTNQFTLANADNEDPVYTYNNAADQHEFFTDGSQRLTITADGDVGIGTTTPDATLHIRPLGGINSEILLDKPGGALLSLKANVSTASIGTENDQDVRFFTNNSTRMHIGKDGNVGIGTVNPNNKLTVFGDANVTGNLGLGTTSPAYRLHAVGSDERVVSALNTATDGYSYGGYFEATDTSSSGVRGESPNIGVEGNGSGQFGTGMFGTGGLTGVFGYGIGDGGRGGKFYGSIGVAAHGDSRGLHGTSAGVDSIGVYGENSSDSGFSYGVMGELTDADATGVAVYGKAPFYGVTGEATDNGVGVIGRANTGLGVYGESSTANGTGVMGANTAASGTTYGVYGISNSNTGYGGYFTGRGHFSGDVGIGTVPPLYRLDVRESATSSNVVHFERDADASSSSDLLELEMGDGSEATTQFIECQRSGGDIEFRVWADGDVSADGIFTPGGADYAEMVRVTSGADSVAPGDVMVIDPAAERGFVKSQTARSTLVAGIFSTRPGVLGSEHDWDQVAVELNIGLNAENPGEGSSAKPIEIGRAMNEVPLAVVGIVPCKVSAENGAIVAGDLLVTSNTPGHAMRDDSAPNGTIVGKALGSLSSGTGVIRVLVTLQ